MYSLSLPYAVYRYALYTPSNSINEVGSVLTMIWAEFWLLKLDIFRLSYYVHHNDLLSQITSGDSNAIGTYRCQKSETLSPYSNYFEV